ncbi:glycosyltransferase [Candidatus Parcubacteria bacterium]|nr:glycosyltransferase [Patescibacteria group bacterium]MCG2694066.1 glycosyltransferase [Candidatus Parcubacteria bacterium]
MKIALVHDYLSQQGGAEKVLKTFTEIWPEAPIFTLFYDEEKMGKMFCGKNIITSPLQKAPGIKGYYQWYLPFMPLATESYNLSGYDVVLSSTSAFAKGILTRPGSRHFSYCHTPTRYLWSETHSYISELNIPKPVKWTLPPVLNKLRLWDRAAADRVDYFIANSDAVAKRIKKYYHRRSEVIYPPVETDKFYISKPEDFYLIGGRLVSYKRYDVVIQAFNKLGIKLFIFGEGPASEYLKSIAKPNIKFLGKVGELVKQELFSKCLAFLHPQEEDFGITAVEAMASGRPVIAYPKGGALETVIPGVTGEFIDEQVWEDIVGEIIRFNPEKYNPEIIREHAKGFDAEVFKEKMKGLIERNFEF